jgi:hypothetical protein
LTRNLSRCPQLPSTTKQTNKQTNTRLENQSPFVLLHSCSTIFSTT